MSIGWLTGLPRRYPTPLADARWAAKREADRKANPHKYRCAQRRRFHPPIPADAKTFNAWVQLGYVVSRGEKARYRNGYGVAYFTPDQVKPRVGTSRNSSGMTPDGEIAFLNSLDEIPAPSTCEQAYTAWCMSGGPLHIIAKSAFEAGFKAGQNS